MREHPADQARIQAVVKNPSTPEDYFSGGEGHIRLARWRRYWKLLRLADVAIGVRAAIGTR